MWAPCVRETVHKLWMTEMGLREISLLFWPFASRQFTKYTRTSDMHAEA